MEQTTKDLISFFEKFEIGIARYPKFLRFIEKSKKHILSFVNTYYDNKFLAKLPQQQRQLFSNLLKKSKSQFRQDLFVLLELDFKKNGFFVELGATNGFDLSNTHLLENQFGWTGILAEPAKCWHDNLRKNRNCYIETRCVWVNSGSILTFNEVDNADFSTISNYSLIDLHKEARIKGKYYEVETISLLDLLNLYEAPKNIDYLSIDTEGCEFEILANFDFDKYQFGVITCEHNFTSMREKIYKLLTSHGYVRKFTDISRFDDWYVRIC
ncbi:Methyltransf_21 domain-containing protein [Gammaproteobacteria bacterium]